MHQIKIWNWTEHNPTVRTISVTAEELQRWKQISTYDEDRDTYAVTDKAWYEVK